MKEDVGVDNAANEEDVGGHKVVNDKAAVQEDKSIDEEDVSGKPAGDKAAVQEDAGDDAGDKAAGNRAAVEEDAVDAVEKAAVDKAAVQEDVEEVTKKQDVEEHEAVVEALLAVGSTAIEGDVMVKHIHSYFDILWRRRSSSELNYVQNIGFVNISFFTSISKMWADEMKLLDTQTDIVRFEKEDQERSQPIESNSPPSPQGKKDWKKRVKKTSDPSLKAVNVWEDYPEFVPLNYQPSSDILRHVTGHQLLYPQPWWQLDSVLIPCHVHGHWMLCHVLLKEGKVMVYDSLNEQRSGLSPRMKEIHGLLYLLPSMLKHAGYYQQIKMDPCSTPFTAESMHSDLIPQQDDGNSCGAFLMKYAELIMVGVPTPWKSIFGQKNIINI
ncbi:hypothetical protein LWI29_019465 [Acer saccharum]|uniref:Ubiquitin-like protease family profile domain-containing protein n=1 Tax=Acer saccharum TaxID=4024 RepID=A0AA39S8E9_ACESA|nr:hypothetical protein LWI29_019465 [Acer saccharum]